ncbi:hypothetical protein NBRC116493_09360 [Aurantivibrio infirmus]
MSDIETSILNAKILSNHIVHVRGKHGVEVNSKTSREANKLISDAMPGNYGMILDRAEDYSIVPVEVFEILNNIPTLKAIAIVVHKDTSAANAEIDRLLYHGDLEIFFSVEQAQGWLESFFDA